MFTVFEKGTTKRNISPFCEFLTMYFFDIFMFSPCGSNLSKVSIQNVFPFQYKLVPLELV